MIRISPCIKLLGSRVVYKTQLKDNKLNKIIYKNFVDNMNNFVIPKNLVCALHFINGKLINLKSSTKFKVYEPRDGKKIRIIFFN